MRQVWAVPRRPALPQNPALADPSLSLALNRASVTAVSLGRYFLTQRRSDKETTVSLGEGLAGWRGPAVDFPSSLTSCCQTHFYFLTSGDSGGFLQDYFLLWFVFQLETPGAPRQGRSLLWPRRLQKDPERNASWGRLLTWEGPKCGGSGWGPHSFPSLPLTEGAVSMGEGNS